MPSPVSTKQKLLAVGLIVIGLMIVGLFGLRTYHAFSGVRGHRTPPPPGAIETDVSLIRDWMTVPFIAHTYNVPGIVLFEALQIPPQGNEKKSLKELNTKYYPGEQDFVLKKVKETVLKNMPSFPPKTDGTAAPLADPSTSQP